MRSARSRRDRPARLRASRNRWENITGLLVDKMIFPIYIVNHKLTIVKLMKEQTFTWRMSSMGKNQYIVRNGSSWGVRGEGNSRLTSRHGTQAEAIQHGRSIAKNQASELD